jgi:hypothetical protein
VLTNTFGTPLFSVGTRAAGLVRSMANSRRKDARSLKPSETAIRDRVSERSSRRDPKCAGKERLRGFQRRETIKKL